MIDGFRSKPLKLFAFKGDASKLPVSGVAVDRLEAQLTALDVATAADQMDVPGWYFHPLKGKPVRFSVRVTANYRLTFGFVPPNASDVDLEDYH
ncbi:MAG: type II toxin-antitoxin system RelE/ParE family toxin [Sphingomicrobium sp.]